VLIESDILIAHIKKKDWLKPIADRIIKDVEAGRFGVVQIPSEVFHELYYVMSEFTTLDTIQANFARIRSLKNVRFLDPNPETYILAVSLVQTYNISSFFDAIYAAHALSPECPDNTIISTDSVYNKIKGIKRIDPRDLYQ